MIVRRFLLWARYAPADQRADAVRALAEAFLAGDLQADDAAEAETALTVMLDDPSLVVRRALAEALAEDRAAPRHIVLALAADHGNVASIVLARSPVLEDADLVDCAALGDALGQAAIAARREVSVGVSAALAEIGIAASLVVLARNEGAHISDGSLGRIMERHGDDASVREALLGRRELPIEVALAIAVAVSASLTTFSTGCGWLSSERTERLTRDARDRAAVALSMSASEDDRRRLVAHLRVAGQLTPVLILRALLSGGLGLVEAALADLAGRPPSRVGAILADRSGQAFRALYDRAGLPTSLRDAFEAALTASSDRGSFGEVRLSRVRIRQALLAVAAGPAAGRDGVAALLRRFESEAAREEAREHADAMADNAALRLLLEHAPETLMIEHERSLAA